MITQVKDLEYMMNWALDSGVTEKKAAGILIECFEGHERSILQALSDSQGQLSLDELGGKVDLSTGVLASVLLGLELKGVVRALPGKMYKIAA